MRESQVKRSPRGLFMGSSWTPAQVWKDWKSRQHARGLPIGVTLELKFKEHYNLPSLKKRKKVEGKRNSLVSSLKKRKHYIFRKIQVTTGVYSWPLNNTDLNCVGLFLMWTFSDKYSITDFFSYDFLNISFLKFTLSQEYNI